MPRLNINERGKGIKLLPHVGHTDAQQYEKGDCKKQQQPKPWDTHNHQAATPQEQQS